MWSVHQRLAELWFKQCHGGDWTDEEERDFKHCLDANMRKAQRFAELYNLSRLADQTQDEVWHAKICAEIDKVKEGMS